MTPFHHFTVDVEEHFQVSALEPFVARADWGQLTSRVELSTGRLLDLLDEHEARGTFFVLGWIAERFPALVREIVERGHEVASHGTDHRKITSLTPDEFRESVRESKQILEQITGAPVRGFRAPSFSIVRGREWALDVLVEEGYVYDSSLFPVRRRGYGYVLGERYPHVIRRAGYELIEFPPATLRAFDTNFPAGGGAYLRLLPYTLTRRALSQAENEGCSATVYIHPWELDPDQPRFQVSPLTRIRQYGGLRRTMPRLSRLLSRFRFRAIEDSLSQFSRVHSISLDTAGVPTR